MMYFNCILNPNQKKKNEREFAGVYFHSNTQRSKVICVIFECCTVKKKNKRVQ